MWIAVNNSVIQDEVLAHRIGLIPIKADPAKLDYVVGEEETDKDTLVFHFDVECTSEITTHKKHNGEFAYLNENALSGALTWLPQGNQEEVFTGTKDMFTMFYGYVNKFNNSVNTDVVTLCVVMRNAHCVNY